MWSPVYCLDEKERNNDDQRCVFFLFKDWEFKVFKDFAEDDAKPTFKLEKTF